MSAPDIKSTIYYFYTTQIAVLQCDKAPTKILVEYEDYVDIFSSDIVIELAENIGINEYIIKLVKRK